jgi:signal transduction histidine kinase
MASWTERVRQADAEDLEILDPRERLEFELLLQWLRLSFLLTPILVLLAYGAPALAYALSIAVAVSVSFGWVAFLARRRPRLLLKLQLWLRVADCTIVYVVLVNYHAFLGNAYYDAVYLLFVVAAAATHGRRGAWTLSAFAGAAVIASRLQLIASGAMPFEVRHLTDAVFYTLFFLMTSTAVAFLMRKSADVVRRRELRWRAEVAARNTELERTANELAESMRLRDAMLTGVTHDLRTPLTVIKVQAQLARRRSVNLPDSAGKALIGGIDQIERAATRMAHWIDELLDVARVQSTDDLQLQLEPTDLVQLTRQAIDEHQQGTQRHTLRLDAPPGEIVGAWDVGRLQRVIDNLVGNAIKYSPAGGQVIVGLEVCGEWAVITVSDQGVGIPAVDLPRVFEPFHRGSNVIGRIGGTGIGLAGTRRIVERHGGSLEVHSTEGAGSTFTVRLPLSIAGM